MSYLWKEFNIKTFVSETAIFRNGKFCPKLSTLTDLNIAKEYDKPIHIIYIGEISGKKTLNINILSENQKIFLSIDIKNKDDASLNIRIKNSGKNSVFLGQIMLDNFSNLDFDCVNIHEKSDTTILVKAKLLAEKNSFSKLSGVAIINKNSPNANSDISFCAMAEKGAKIEFIPAQKISSIPKYAAHSASIYKPSFSQIEYLREAGLSGQEAKSAMREAFLKDFSLF